MVESRPMTITDELRASAEAWMKDDPDADTVGELQALLDADDAEAVIDRFLGSLQFGTAGLRGLLGAGPNRMNRKVVLRATAGLCAYVLEHVEGAEERGLCIAYDGRRKSRLFAEDAASVALGAGLKVRVFETVTPTPVLAYACRKTHAAAGIVVTASHNPPDYNGYKVYWANAAQIVPPQDEGIAAKIAAVGELASIPRVPSADAPERVTVLGEELEAAYLAEVVALAVHPELPRDVTVAYTAMHGVGDRLARRALAEAGFGSVHTVAEQAEPDGAFPTVAFPNPEEDGAMDLLLAKAASVDADVAFANDPDADRLAVAVRRAPGDYVQLSGNDVGCLIGHYLLSEGPQDGERLVVNTIVSSPMLGAIAAAHGARWEQTLTGFKWIANRALELEGSVRFVYGYEEALGYTVGSIVRDKDGIGTAVLVADLAAWCKSRGGTLLSELEVAWRRYGMYLSQQVSKVLPGEEGKREIAEMMARVREASPKQLDGRAVLASSDLLSGERVLADGSTSALSFPKGNVLAFELEGGHRVMLRPSGTEPKIKSYFDVCVTMAEGEAVDAARARGEAILGALAGALAAL